MYINIDVIYIYTDLNIKPCNVVVIIYIVWSLVKHAISSQLRHEHPFQFLIVCVYFLAGAYQKLLALAKNRRKTSWDFVVFLVGDG